MLLGRRSIEPGGSPAAFRRGDVRGPKRADGTPMGARTCSASFRWSSRPSLPTGLGTRPLHSRVQPAIDCKRLPAGVGGAGQKRRSLRQHGPALRQPLVRERSLRPPPRLRVQQRVLRDPVLRSHARLSTRCGAGPVLQQPHKRMWPVRPVFEFHLHQSFGRWPSVQQLDRMSRHLQQRPGLGSHGHLPTCKMPGDVGRF